LRSTNAEIVAAARTTLARLTTNTPVAILALRWLVADRIRKNDLLGAEEFSNQLLSRPAAELSDRLQHLTILQRNKDGIGSHRLSTNGAVTSAAETRTVKASFAAASARFADSLSWLQAKAATNALEMFLICEWMGNHELAQEALKWLAQSDPKLRQLQPMPLAEANLYLSTRDWPALEVFLKKQQWADLDFLRVAMQARAAWGQSQNLAGEAHWLRAVRSANNRLSALMLLLSLAIEWGRDPENLLWEIGRRFPGEHWALRQLEHHYWTAGDAPGLNRIYSVLEREKSSGLNVTNRNNFAITAMLLRQDLPRAYATACDLYQTNPEDPVLASTYAYSLHLQGQTQAALSILKKLPSAALETPAMALYYGVLLSAVGETNSATRYLSLAEGANLLPEEKLLLATAKKAIQ
jgi:hypothetical protein